jgi:hypothetical protein
MLALLFMGAMNWAKTASTQNSFLAAQASAAHMRNPLPYLENSGFAQKGASGASVAAKGGMAGVTTIATKKGTIVVGGGAKLENLTAGEIARIQNAANRTGTEITVVGSRSTGTANVLSDWDYIVPAGTRSKTINSLKSSLPEGIKGGYGQDLFRGQLEANKPYITFKPGSPK